MMETFGRPRSCLRRLGLSITRRRIRHKRVKQLVRRVRYLIHRAVEGRLVCLGGAREAAQFSHELEGRRTDLLVRDGRIEVVQRPYASTHGKSSSPPEHK
jgi:hypothetical protein